MDRKALLKILVTSTRANLGQIVQVLEEMNQDHRERTYPATLERSFRAIEHDARVAGLPRYGEACAWAKAVGKNILKWRDPLDPLELLTEVAAEFGRVADHLAAGKQHELDHKLMNRLRAAAKGVTTEPSLSESEAGGKE